LIFFCFEKFVKIKKKKIVEMLKQGISSRINLYQFKKDCEIFDTENFDHPPQFNTEEQNNILE
jgi:hypothetical protein